MFINGLGNNEVFGFEWRQFADGRQNMLLLKRYLIEMGTQQTADTIQEVAHPNAREKRAIFDKREVPFSSKTQEKSRRKPSTKSKNGQNEDSQLSSTLDDEDQPTPNPKVTYVIGTVPNKTLVADINRKMKSLLRSFRDSGAAKLTGKDKETMEVEASLGRMYFYGNPRHGNEWEPEWQYSEKTLNKVLRNEVLRPSFIQRLPARLIFLRYVNALIKTSTPSTTTYTLNLSFLNLRDPNNARLTIKLDAAHHFPAPNPTIMDYRKEEPFGQAKPVPQGPARILEAYVTKQKIFVADVVRPGVGRSQEPEEEFLGAPIKKRKIDHTSEDGVKAVSAEQDDDNASNDPNPANPLPLPDIRFTITHKTPVPINSLDPLLTAYLSQIYITEELDTPPNSSKKRRKRAQKVPYLHLPTPTPQTLHHVLLRARLTKQTRHATPWISVTTKSVRDFSGGEGGGGEWFAGRELEEVCVGTQALLKNVRDFVESFSDSWWTIVKIDMDDLRIGLFEGTYAEY